MKRYVFFLPRVCNIGGAENYVNSKLRWLNNKGWSTAVLHYDKGPIMLSYLKEKHIRIPELEYFPLLYSSRKLSLILQTMVTSICDDNYDEVIIESSKLPMSIWAEIVASKIHAKHLFYCLEEKETVNPSFKDYINFKLNRKELAGIDLKSIEFLLDSCGIKRTDHNSPFLTAYSDGVVVDYSHPMIDIIKKIPHDFVIGSIGRLEKPFLQITIKELVEYVKKDSSHSYILLMIGGTNGYLPGEQSIEEMCDGVINLHLLITGFIYPIPSKLITLCDIVISSAGSCWASVQEGVPTISIDAEDYQPIGVIPYTTKSALHRTNEIIRPLETYLFDALQLRLFKHFEPIVRTDVDYSSHLDFIENSNTDYNYYEFKALRKNNNLKRLLFTILGSKLYCCIANFRVRFFKKSQSK